MENKLKTFIEDWQGKFLNDYLQPTLETQYDRIKESLHRKLWKNHESRPQSNATPQVQNYFTTVDSAEEGENDE